MSNEAQTATISIDGVARIEVRAPKYVSFAHAQNQDRVSSLHSPEYRARVGATTSGSDLVLEVTLRSQGRDVSKTSYTTLKPTGNEPAFGISPIKLDSDFLLEVREATSASFVFRLKEGELEVDSVEIPTMIYPPNLWMMSSRDSFGSSGMMLTAFVRPRDPSLDSILTRARQIKGTYAYSDGSPMSPDTAGYQGSDEDVFAEVRAIYEAIQELGIYYSNPPGSLDWTQGQLIRSNQEILDTKAATCLDSTVLFASLLENINLRPLIVIRPGHAFVGFWTRTGSRSAFSTTIAPAEEAVQYLNMEKPYVRFVETTRLCKSPEQVGFLAAVSQAENDVRRSLDRANEEDERDKNSWRVIDLSIARREGFRPMASKVKNADGTSSVIEYSIETQAVSLNIEVETAKLGALRDESPARVRFWKSQLLDLTFNNPLLNMRRRSGSQVRLLIPKGRLGIVEDFLQQPKSELRLAPGLEFGEPDETGTVSIRAIRSQADGTVPEEDQQRLDNSFASNQTLSFEVRAIPKANSIEGVNKASFNKVRTLSRSAKQSIEETGANNLYMTFGSLRWKRKDASGEKDDYVVSPLILMPVVLKQIDKGKFWSLSLDETNDIATNETLALKLSTEYGIEIPALTAPAEDAAGIDIPALVQAVRNAVIEAKQSSWIVTEDSTIGTYDFSTFHIWKDLNDNWEKLSKSSLVKHLIETDGTTVFDDPNRTDAEITEEELDAEFAKVPVPSDGTQMRAVVRSLRGESFIIQGPPGTGKSQTITNLLARNLQAGRKVLFMSEKPAALEVVKSRLDEIKLGTFVLDLHSKNTSPAEIRNQILAALDANPRIDNEGIQAATFEFDVATKALAKYPERLHRVHEKYQHSVYSIRAKLLALRDTEPLTLSKSALSYFDSEKVVHFMSDLADLPGVGQQAGIASGNHWSFSNLLGEQATGELREALTTNLRSTLAATKTALQGPGVPNVLDLATTLEQLRSIAESPSRMPSAEELAELGKFEYREKVLAHTQLLEELSDAASGSKAKSNFGEAPVQELWSDLKEAAEAKLFKKKKLQAVASSLVRFWSDVDAETVVSEMTVAKKLFELAEKVADSSRGIPAIPPMALASAFEDEAISKRIQLISATQSLAKDISSNPESFAAKLAVLSDESRSVLIPFAQDFLALISAVKGDAESFEIWRSNRQLSELLEQCTDKWESDLIDSEFRTLIRWGNLLQLVATLKEAEQGQARREILEGSVEFSNAPVSFERAYLELLQSKLLEDHELGNFEAGMQNSSIEKLKKSSDSLRIYNRDTISGAVVKGRTFDPTAIAGRAGALRSEINKQRGQMPIRQLMKKYWDTITEITPCVAASPDSVARFLDVNLADFDVVIFDEASQLRVPNSIGALGRGKSAIIVGDSKQMPPTQLFSSDNGTEDEETLVQLQPDVESILTMAEYSKLPSVMLQWHYRSQDESLIAFSNNRYYQGLLSSFPSPQEESTSSRAVEWVPVLDGEYFRNSSAAAKAQLVQESEEDEEFEADYADEIKVASAAPKRALVNTNPREAEKVVEKVLELYAKEGSSLNLGIVTMNEQQRAAIVALLEAKADDGLKALMNKEKTPDYLFVRALEKVQGDERDVILMSIAFARVPDPRSPRGFTVPQNFGPLIRAGSERRLNVAVTRARKKVYVFSSFEPEDLRINDTSSLGMRGLRDYLLLAKDGPAALGLGNRSGFEEPDRHRMQVAKAIENLGYKTKQEVGLSSFRVDIGILHPEKPGKYILAVLLDGPNWRSRPTASDRDVLPVGVLEKNMGWPAVERIWMPNWIKDPAEELGRLSSTIERILRSSEAVQEETPMAQLPDISSILQTAVHKEETAAVEQTPTSTGVNVDDIEPFSELPIRPIRYGKDDLHKVHDSGVRDSIVNLTRVLTQIEGPVHPDRLVSFVAKCFGLSHVRSERAAEIVRVIPINTFQRDTEGFIFPEGKTVATFTWWKRKTSGEPRDLRLISLTELGNSMVDLCRKTHGLQQEELLRQTGLAFGHKTLSSVVRARTERALAFALSRKLLVLNGDHYEPSGS